MADLTTSGIAGAHHESLLSLNNECVPHVNELTAPELRHLLGMSTVARAAWRDDVLAGALVALGPGADYASANYRWFDGRFSDFVYVDRVIVPEPMRGLGVGRRLYEELVQLSPPGTRRVLCEVNLDPPNEGSMAFHQRLGFEAVGRLHHPGSGKTVAMLSKSLAHRRTGT